MTKTMNIGIDHGYYAIKTRHFSFPAGISEYSHEPYTLQNTLEYGGKFYVCGTGRQPILRNKMENDNYYLLTLAAIAKEIKQRGEKTECSVKLAAGLPLAGFGREKKPFRAFFQACEAAGRSHPTGDDGIPRFPTGRRITLNIALVGCAVCCPCFG